jgi:hypothetical protein
LFYRPDNIPAIFLKLAADFLAGPLTAIINNCIDSLKYPTLWKLARISPIPKIDNPEHVDYFRPILILPCISKVF